MKTIEKTMKFNMSAKRCQELPRHLADGSKGSQDTSQMALGAAKTRPGRVQERPRAVQDGSKSIQEVPRSPPTRLQQRSRTSKSAQEPPRRRHKPPRRLQEHPRRLQDVPRSIHGGPQSPPTACKEALCRTRSAKRLDHKTVLWTKLV